MPKLPAIDLPTGDREAVRREIQKLRDALERELEALARRVKRLEDR